MRTTTVSIISIQGRVFGLEVREEHRWTDHDQGEGYNRTDQMWQLVLRHCCDSNSPELLELRHELHQVPIFYPL